MKTPQLFIKQTRAKRRYIYNDRRGKQETALQYIKAVGFSTLRALVPFTNKRNKYRTQNNELILDLFDYWESQALDLQAFND